jgi:hypothetical protein
LGKDYGVAMKYLIIVILFLSITGNVASARSTYPGAFSRMGFGPRGTGLGNAAVGISNTNLGSYYNPATIAFTRLPLIEAAYGFLSLDRSLNYFHFTTHIPPGAGFSLSVINAGVSKIDGRNRDGVHTGYYSTSENLFTFAFATQFTERFSGGIAFKLYYHRLFEEMQSTTVGFDLGLLYRVNGSISIGASVKDLNSKYKWDSSPLYEQSGRSTTDSFPLLVQVGGAYLTTDKTLLIAVQTEYSKELNLSVKFGAEAYLTENITLRGGIERLNDLEATKPSLGFSVTYPLRTMVPSFHYTIIFEPYAPSGIHLLGIGLEF